MKICPCNSCNIFLVVKNKTFGKILIFFIFLCKKLIVGTSYNPLHEAVLRSTHNLCFGSKIRKKYTSINPSFTVQGGIHCTDMFS